MGLINYCHRFPPNVAQPLAPLHIASCSRKKSVQWIEFYQESFDCAKSTLGHTTLLYHPRANAITSIAVDASSVGIGAQLDQLHDGMWVPIAFISRKLSITGQNYNAFDRELLAAYTAIRNFRYYVEGNLSLHIQITNLSILHFQA